MTSAGPDVAQNEQARPAGHVAARAVWMTLAATAVADWAPASVTSRTLPATSRPAVKHANRIRTVVNRPDMLTLAKG